jgi:hypothetical protein
VEATNPYEPPVAPNVKPLGSLAQSARGNELKQAQGILIVIGVLTIAVNAFFLYNLPKEIQQATQQNQVAPADVEQFRQQVTILGYLIYGLPLLLGALFVVFGLIVKQYPLPITITSLVLYVLSIVVFGVLNPTTLAQGLIVKIFFILGLCRAIRAAGAYQAHRRESGLPEGMPA